MAGQTVSASDERLGGSSQRIVHTDSLTASDCHGIMLIIYNNVNHL